MHGPRVPSLGGFNRRSLLTALGAGGGGLVLAMPLPLAAQDATPATGTLPPPLEEWPAGWRTSDPARIAAAYSETASIVDMPAAITLEGRDAIQAYLTQFFSAFEDFSSEILTLFATEEWAAAEWTFSGRYTGEFPGFPPGEGQEITAYGAEILGLAGGQIQQDHRYYDVYGLLVQLGILPAPGGAATPAS